MKLSLQNIYSYGRKISLFTRESDGSQKIIEDNEFYPYYYELHEEGQYLSYDGKKLKKIYCSQPKEIKENRSSSSYESDINYTSRYANDKIEEIIISTPKIAFLDIEVLCDKFPNSSQAKYPISCVSIYDNYTKKVKSFYLGHYESEYLMLEKFTQYMKQEAYDIWLMWNGDNFDIPYLSKRIPDFAKKVSPIGQERYSQKDLYYPAGVSFIDYMKLDKKYTLNRQQSYSLDARLQDTLGRGKALKKVDFSKLSNDIITRCENDVRDMGEMEEKVQYIPLLNGIRCLTKVKWEDYQYNSRSIDQLLLAEAKKQKIILPKKPTKEDNGEEFEGAFREIFNKGAIFNHGAYDISGAYLNAIIDLCLDPVNVKETNVENSIPINVTDRKTNKIIKTYHIVQNSETILPKVAFKLLNEKNKFKELLKNTDPSDPTFKDKEDKYKAWKILSLSSWGVIGNKYFRYYDSRITSLITSTIRDLLHYTIDKLKEQNYSIDYIDTDGIITDDKGNNICDLLNQWTQEWSQERFNKPTQIKFEYEGHWESLLLIALCRYKGRLKRPDGEIEEKEVGVEAKRKDSSIYLKTFQTILINKLLDKEDKEKIINWIKTERERIKTLPLTEIAFPCKIGRELEDYVNEPIFIRALRYAKENKLKLDKKIGELFYYIYVKSDKYEDKIEKVPYYKGNKLTPKPMIELAKKYLPNLKVELEKVKSLKVKDKKALLDMLDNNNIIEWQKVKIKGKNKDVMAFDEKTQTIINNVDYDKMIERNIDNKVDIIFDAMGWDIEEIGGK